MRRARVVKKMSYIQPRTGFFQRLSLSKMAKIEIALAGKNHSSPAMPPARQAQYCQPKNTLMLRALLSITLFCLTLAAQAQAPAAWQKAAEQLAASPQLEHGLAGIAVIDVATGKTVASTNGKLSIKPASNLKVLTTGTALALLGPDYRFETRLEYDGTIGPQGVLEGHLYLYGEGDPTLGSPLHEEASSRKALLEAWRMAIQKAGIREIRGQIIGDASLFGDQAYIPTWQWEDMGNYYAAGAWSLNWHENLHYLRFQQAQEGKPPQLKGTEPFVPGLSFTNSVVSGSPGSGDNAYIFGAPYQYERYVRGSIPAGHGEFTIKGALPNPPLLAAQELEQELRKIGVVTKGAAAIFNPKQGQRKVLHRHQSPTLAAIVMQANQKSVNLYCEVLLRAIGWRKGAAPTPEAGIKAMQEYWEGRGLDWGGVALDDGSGLSEANTVTANFLAAFMRKMALGPEGVYEAFLASLPLAGRTGSLKNTLKGTAAEGRLYAKTGTLERVRGLTGYTRSSSGALLAFSVIVNNYEGPGWEIRKAMERFLLSLCTQ